MAGRFLAMTTRSLAIPQNQGTGAKCISQALFLSPPPIFQSGTRGGGSLPPTENLFSDHPQSSHFHNPTLPPNSVMHLPCRLQNQVPCFFLRPSPRPSYRPIRGPKSPAAQPRTIRARRIGPSFELRVPHSIRSELQTTTATSSRHFSSCHRDKSMTMHYHSGKLSRIANPYPIGLSPPRSGWSQSLTLLRVWGNQYASRPLRGLSGASFFSAKPRDP